MVIGLVVAGANGLTREAERTIQGILDKRNLYTATTKHEKRLLRRVRDLSNFIAVQRGVVDAALFWKGFRQWILKNKEAANSYANAFMSQYLLSKGDQASAGQTIRLYVSIWRTWGINVSTTVTKQIKTLDREKWAPLKTARLNKLQQAKTEQFEELEPKWRQMVAFMGSVAPNDFRAHLKRVINHRGDHVGVAASSFNEMTVLANKTDSALGKILASTLAFASTLRYTGMRSISALELTLDAAFAVQDDGHSVLLTRTERKVGSLRNVEKQVFVRIAPHKDPRLCTLVHIAHFVSAAVVPSDSQTFLFCHGFTKKRDQDRVNFCKLPQRRYIAVLQVVAIACGMANGLGQKRLHVFRIMCENVLGSLGATTKDRQDYIGWARDTQSRNYSSHKHRALHSAAPYLMAGRQGKADPPHPMWDFINMVPPPPNGQKPLSYWDKVVYIATAAGFLDNNVTTVDPAFQTELREHIAQVSNARAETNPRLLLKRVRQLEDELRQHKMKAARTELPSDESSAASSSPRNKLVSTVQSLKARNKEKEFPNVCAEHFVELARLIEAGGGIHNSFCLELSTSVGKDLVRVLVLGAIASSKPQRGAYQNWFSFVNGERSTRYSFISTQSWTKFRESVALISPLS